MKKLLLIGLVLLSFSVAAIDLSTDSTGYTINDTVLINISSCEGNSIVQVISPDDDIIDIMVGVNNWTTTYNTNSHGEAGKYGLVASCQNGVETLNFCFEDDDCLTTVKKSEEGGRDPSSAIWSCEPYSFCDGTLNQTRICHDRRSGKPDKIEKRACTECQESWVCNDWTACTGGRETRTCVDEHACSTFVHKPAESRACTVAATQTSQQPEQQTGQPAPTRNQPRFAASQRPTSVKETAVNVWNDFMVYIIAIPVVLILIIVGLIILHKRKKKKDVTYHPAELLKWVKAEKEAGTANSDIVDILAGNLGWKKEKVLTDFPSLRKIVQPKV